MAAHRERRMLHAIVRLMGDATGGGDLDERLQILVDECVALFDVDAAGLILFGRSGDLHVAASTGHYGALLELLQVEAGEGPCLEAARTGEVIAVPEVAAVEKRWPHFSRSATDAGYASAHSVPLRFKKSVVGSFNLFGQRVGPFDPDDLAAARALADIATINILQHRAHNDVVQTQAQLQAALDSRTVIEQAKGWIANGNSVSLDTAYLALRDYSRRNRLPMAEVALGVLSRRLTLSAPPSGD
jgi:GAF domain-containing protein